MSTSYRHVYHYCYHHYWCPSKGKLLETCMWIHTDPHWPQRHKIGSAKCSQYWKAPERTPVYLLYKKQLWFPFFVILSTFPSSPHPPKINVDSPSIGFHVFLMSVSSAYFNSKCESHLKSRLVIIWKSISYETNKQINKSVWSGGQIRLRREVFLWHKNAFSAWKFFLWKERVENFCDLFTALSRFHVARFPGCELKASRLNLSGSINRGTCPSTAEDLFQDLHITEKNYKAEINTSPIITHCRLGSIPRFPWLFVLIKCLHGT